MLSLQYEKPLGPTLMYINIDIKEKPFTFSIYAVLLHVTIYRNSRNPYLIYFLNSLNQDGYITLKKRFQTIVPITISCNNSYYEKKEKIEKV